MTKKILHMNVTEDQENYLENCMIVKRIIWNELVRAYVGSIVEITDETNEMIRQRVYDEHPIVRSVAESVVTTTIMDYMATIKKHGKDKPGSPMKRGGVTLVRILNKDFILVGDELRINGFNRDGESIRIMGEYNENDMDNIWIKRDLDVWSLILYEKV